MDIAALTKQVSMGKVQPTQKPMFHLKIGETLSAFLMRGDARGYAKALSETEIESLKFHDRLQLHAYLVEQLGLSVEKFSQGDFAFCVITTLQKWTSPDDQGDICGVFGDLMSYAGCSIIHLKTIAAYVEGLNAYEIIESQLKVDNGLTFPILYDRCKIIFGKHPITPQNMESLIAMSNDAGREEIARYINEIMTVDVYSARKPKWVTIKDEDDPKYLDYNFWKGWVMSETAKKKIESLEKDKDVQTERKFLDTEDVEEGEMYGIHGVLSGFQFTDKDGNEYTRDDIEDVLDIAKSFAISSDLTSYPTDVDRIFGPLNRRKVECISGVIPGGCRMLTCRCKDFDQEEEGGMVSGNPSGWFNGKCDDCGRRIADISYAIRQPVFNGGWSGEYCSFECMSKSQSIDLYGDFMMVIDFVRDVLDKSGIVDRPSILKISTDTRVPKKTAVLPGLEFLAAGLPIASSLGLPVASPQGIPVGLPVAGSFPKGPLPLPTVTFSEK